MVGITVDSRIGTKIPTEQGDATYFHTELEGPGGVWDNHWETRDGAFVIHTGIYHHVYIIKEETDDNTTRPN